MSGNESSGRKAACQDPTQLRSFPIQFQNPETCRSFRWEEERFGSIFFGVTYYREVEGWWISDDLMFGPTAGCSAFAQPARRKRNVDEL